MGLHFTASCRFSTAQAVAVMTQVITEVFGELGYDAWITSALRAPSPTTLHDNGLAYDLRVNHIPLMADRRLIANRLKARLAPQFDVIYGDAQHLDHIHVEYDPD